MEFRSKIRIEAGPERVWQVLTDGERWPEWEANTERIVGTIAEGEKITVHSKMGGRAFPVRVRDFIPSQQMTWAGGMPLGLFRGIRTFMLSSPEEGVTEFSMAEVFSGVLLPVFGRTIPDLQPSFDSFTAALKERAEG